MELKAAIEGRRSVRKYSDKQIDDATLNEIFMGAGWAPSGVNLQPWYFVAVKSKEAHEKLAAFLKDLSEKNRDHLESRFAAYPDIVKNTLNFLATMGSAPVVVLAFRDKPDYSWALADDGIVQSISAAIENLLLTAYDHGVYSCWLSAAGQAQMNGMFRDAFAPGHGEMVAMICLGYPKEGAVPPAPKRKENKWEII